MATPTADFLRGPQRTDEQQEAIRQMQEAEARQLAQQRAQDQKWKGRGVLGAVTAGALNLFNRPDQDSMYQDALRELQGQQVLAGEQVMSTAGRGMPAELMTHNALVEAARSDDELASNAARVRLGLSGRAPSAAAQRYSFTGADGRERTAMFDPTSQTFNIYDEASGQWRRASPQEARRAAVSAEQQPPMEAPSAEVNPQVLSQALGGVEEPQTDEAPQVLSQALGGVEEPAAAARQPSGMFTGPTPEAAATPQGFRYDEAAGRYTLIPGSEQAREFERQQRSARQLLERRVPGLLRDINRAIENADHAGPLRGVVADAEPGAGLLRRAIATQSPAYELSQHLNSVKSNISIDELQSMREASPTGGALGQVPVRQQEFLMQVQGALLPTLDEPVLRENLSRVHNTYVKAMLDAAYGDAQELAEAVADGRISQAEADVTEQQRREFEDELMKRTEFDDWGRREQPVQLTAENADAEYEALEPGTPFIAPDGRRGVKR